MALFLLGFFRLTTVLVRMPYTDLENLSLRQWEYYVLDGDIELLYSTRVLRMDEIGEEGDKYILRPLQKSTKRRKLWI